MNNGICRLSISIYLINLTIGRTTVKTCKKLLGLDPYAGEQWLVQNSSEEPLFWSLYYGDTEDFNTE